MKVVDITAIAFLLRLGIAALLGSVIGFERQWRQRAVGMHTTSLVAIGAALFALLDVTIAAGDKTRIVAGVVTGVGFIAGGVILRTGMNVSGLNTAATIWATAAVGALAGFGLWAQAIAGATAVVLFNVLLQPLADRLDARHFHHDRRETIYKLTVLCDREKQPAIGDAVVAGVSAGGLNVHSMTRRETEGRQIELYAEIHAAKPADATIERLSAQVLEMPGVGSIEWVSSSAH
ncbi:MAG: MgtC/SapB family protein [Candidatus Baltobacteraceae bacterium]